MCIRDSVDTVRNLLVLAGTRTQADGGLDIVATFDVDLLKGMSVGVFPLKNVTVGEVDAALRLLSGGAPSAVAVPPSSTPGVLPGAGLAASSGLPSNFPLFGALRVIPIERINSVLIITPRAAYLDEARRWLETVSYTHLDVYKRQDHSGASADATSGFAERWSG